MSHIRCNVLVCSGTGCSSTDSPKVLAAFEREIKRNKLQDEVRVVKTGCIGLCERGPNVLVFPEGACYCHVTDADVAEIVTEHLIKGRIVTRLLQKDRGGDETATSLSETRFYKHQLRIALRNCGVINPESIDEYLGVDGYVALERILTEQTPPQEIIDCIKKSGLRGRGGAGFSTGLKWQFTHDAVSEDGIKYVCCNADEGDPGAFMDRSVLEGDPFSVIEAMTIAGYAIGSSQGYIYVRAEYPIAVKRLEIAIGSMMGSGGLIVMDEDNCMVDIAKFFLQFCVDESCGKCAPCRIGTKRLYDLLDKITNGEGTLEDLDTIEELCQHLKSSALCALGQSAPNPVLSTLRYFRDEYVAHVVEKRCPAGVCRNLLRFTIDPSKCKGCTLCAKNCPVNAISGTVKIPHTIDPSKCIKCGLCKANCRFDAIIRA